MDLIQLLAKLLVGGICVVALTYGLILIAPYLAVVIIGIGLIILTKDKEPPDNQS